MNFDLMWMREDIGQVAGTVILFIAFFALWFALSRFIARLERQKRVSSQMANGARRIVRWIFLLVILIAVLQAAGIKLSGLVTGLLAVLSLLAVGFVAFWSLLSNILCGLLMMGMDIFRIGDEIELVEIAGGPGIKGRVVGFNLLNTLIREEKEAAVGRETAVPNNFFLQKCLRRIPGKGITLSAHLLKGAGGQDA